MKIRQFRLRTLFLLTAIMGLLFVACAKWPVTDNSTANANDDINSKSSVVDIGILTITRLPTPAEWMIRAGITSAVLIATIALIGVWRARRARFVARQPSPH